MVEIEVGYFVEDRGHRDFLQSLVSRIAADLDPGIQLRHNPRQAVGGHGSALTELRRFLRDVHSGKATTFDILVVAIDANCKGYTTVRNGIKDLVDKYQYPTHVAYAIPDPHIERWYMVDSQALHTVAGEAVALPVYKCERDYYKELLRQVFPDAPSGGLEHGSAIAIGMDLYRAGQTDPSFDHFVSDARSALRLNRKL